MIDHAETILQALHLLGPDPVDDDAELHEGQLHGYEALRLLVAERDEAQKLYEIFRERYESKYTEWDASRTNAVKNAEIRVKAAEQWAERMEHERDYEQQVVTVDLRQRLEEAEWELHKANEVRRVLTELLHDVWRSYTLLEADQAHLDHSMEAVERLLFADDPDNEGAKL